MNDQNISEASKKLLKAKALLILDYPFFGLLVLRLKYKETTDISSAGVDGKTCFYNPMFIDQISLPETIGLLAHEIMHVALGHHVRRYNRNPKKWNIACDYAIDPILLNSMHGNKKLKLPELTFMGAKYGPHIKEEYKNMSADHIYSLLPDPPPNAGSLGVVFDSPSLSDGDNNSPDDETKGQKLTKEGYDNIAVHEEIEWKIAASQAAQSAKAVGKLPASLEELIEEINKPKINWIAVLRTFMIEIRRDDYDWSRPNRRHICNNIFLPRMYSEGMGEVVLVVDTSGSITKEELKQFAGELNSILGDVKPSKVHVIYCDAAIRKVVEVLPEDFPVPLEKKGGGGTDFTEPFKWVTKNVNNPACLVYLTDLYGPCHADKPMYPVLWVCTSNQTDVEFGQVLPLQITND